MAGCFCASAGEAQVAVGGAVAAPPVENVSALTTTL